MATRKRESNCRETLARRARYVQVYFRGLQPTFESPGAIPARPQQRSETAQDSSRGFRNSHIDVAHSGCADLVLAKSYKIFRAVIGARADVVPG